MRVKLIILGHSDKEGYAGFEVNIPRKDMHTAGESKKTELKDCEFESSHEPVLQLLKPDTQSIDSLIQTSKSHRSKIKRTSNNTIPTGMSSRELEDKKKNLEQCIDYLVKRASKNLCKEDQYVPCAQTKCSEKCLGENIEPSGGMQVQKAIVERGTKKQMTSKGGASNELRMKEMKKTIKCIDILSSCLEEVGRMNDILKDKITKIHSELDAVHRLTRWASKTVNKLKNVSECTVLRNETDRHLPAIVDVYAYGVSLLQDLIHLYIKIEDIFVKVDAFRLELINLSESLSSIELELFVKNQQNILFYWIEDIKHVYTKFFNKDACEILHEQFVAEFIVLKDMAAEFETLLNILHE